METIWCLDSQVVRAMKRGLKLQNKLEKKRIPYLSVNPFSVSGICSHGNRFIMRQQYISNGCTWNQQRETTMERAKARNMLEGERIAKRDCRNVRMVRMQTCHHQDVGHFLSLCLQSQYKPHRCQKRGFLVLTLGN